MHPSFSALAVGLGHLPAEETIEIAAAAGFASADLLVRDLVRSGTDPAMLRARMDRLGLRDGAWHLPVRWRGDRATYEADLAELPALAAAARTLGLQRTGTAVLAETPTLPVEGADPEALLDEVAAFHVERLGPVARILADHGTALGLEVVGVRSFRTGKGIPFVARLTDLDRRLGRIWDESGNLGVLVDAFHLYAAGEPADAGLAWGAGRITWVHVADLPRGAGPDRDRIIDNNRGLPGENGAVDVAGVLRRLQSAGYSGPVTVETLAGCRSLRGLTPAEVARAARESLRSAWPY